MKMSLMVLGAALVGLSAGCSSPVQVGTVGPNPNRPGDHVQYGQLEVFSAPIVRTEGDDLSWHQHEDYRVFDSGGHFVKYVGNDTGYYARSSRIINLAPGKYIVKARAKDYLAVKVPVVIKPGRITRAHLDDAWAPSSAANTEIVKLPDGEPIGWTPEAY